MKNFILLKLFVLLVLVCSCRNDDDSILENLSPTVAFESETYVYKVKLGRQLKLEPIIENDIEATYSWKINGKIVSMEKNYTYTAEAMSVDEIFAEFTVLTSYGTASAEVRIDVVELDKPVIGLAVPENGYMIPINTPLILDPQINSSLETTYSWKINGEKKSTEKTLTFNSGEKGEYTITLDVANEDGEDHMTFVVKSVLPEEMPFAWTFDQTVFNMSQGRVIRLMPFDIENAFDAMYKWEVDGSEKQNSAEPAFIFSGDQKGTLTVKVTMTNSYGEKQQTLTVKVDGPEGTHRKLINSGSSITCNKVYEFLPAPGQFVNDGYTCTTMEQAVEYAKGQFDAKTYVSLGGFGGCVVVGFDHSIENSGGYDIQIASNYGASGMSEAGVVWVMQDENGDGLPNDTWYELKGSEYGKPETIQDYAITYYKPKVEGGVIAWKDNQGKNGIVERNGYHGQEYYPKWVSAATYTLRGTRLESHVIESRPGYWEVPGYDWGYVDNPSSIDNLGQSGSVNHFKISDAVRFDGEPANLQYIDFIKVQNCVSANAGVLGEVSTEVVGFKDYNMMK